LIEKIKKWSINFFAKEDSTYHILVFVISSVLYPFFPIIWFIIFMKEKMIFSYDFFTNGMFGLSIFFFFSLILFLLLGFLLVGFFTFATIYIYKRKEEPNHDSKIALLILFIINCIVFLTLTKINTFILYIAVLNIFIFIHIGILFVGRGLHKFASLIVFTFIFIFSSFYFHQIISTFIENGLLQFRMGGDIKTKIIDMKNHQNIIEGNLTLLTPNKVFLHSNKTMTIFNRDNIIIEIMDKNITK